MFWTEGIKPVKQDGEQGIYPDRGVAFSLHDGKICGFGSRESQGFVWFFYRDNC